jgi:adenine-specific DNA-methyltransferase
MNKLKMHSPDLTQANIDKLAALFPNCVAEARSADGVVKRSIDFDQLRQELSGSIVEARQAGGAVDRQCADCQDVAPMPGGKCGL